MTVSWNTALSTNGSHRLTAIAGDLAGNTGTSADVLVTVNNPVPPVPVTVPNVVGQTQATAQTNTTNAGLVSAINTAHSPTVPPGLVISQTPVGGASAARGSTVTLLVSLGPAARANLDQCGNDPAPSSDNDGCSASATDWVNGALGATTANYLEGDSIPYRMTFANLSTTGTHAVTIEWDTTKLSTHAIDYLTTFQPHGDHGEPVPGRLRMQPRNVYDVRDPCRFAGWIRRGCSSCSSCSLQS